MTENLSMLVKKLDNLARMRGDVQHSIGKMPGPLAAIEQGNIGWLTPDQRETLSAFTTRFATYQEQLGKAMKSVAIEEESATSPFGAILALMEKLDILEDHATWREIRELRNAVNHEYVEEADESHELLCRMVDAAPWLFVLHDRLLAFVKNNYGQ